MKNRTLIIMTLAGFACAPLEQLICDETQNIAVNMVPFCGTDGFNALGPMAVIVHIYNRSTANISLLENYVDGQGIDMTVSGAECDPIGNSMVRHIGDHHLVTIKPSSEFNYPLYLNNMYRFAPGTAQITWTAKLKVLVNNRAELVSSSGNFPVNIRTGNTEELSRELSRLLDFSINIEDSTTKMGKIDGLCSIRDLLVIPYLQRLLNVPGGEYRALETLIDVWNGEPSAEKIVDNFIETTSDADKLRFNISLYHEKHRLLTEPQMSRLLKSKEDTIRFCGVLYINGILDSLHLTDSIPRLSKDPNGGIVAQCDEILRVFSDALSKSDSKSFNKQAAAKATANGF